MISQIEAIQPGVGYSTFSVAFLVKIVKRFCQRWPKLSTNKKRQTAKPVSQMQMCGGRKSRLFGKTQNKRMEIQSVIVCTVPGKENRTHLTCQKGSCSLDKRIKNHYTTNRKGAVHNGQLPAQQSRLTVGLGKLWRSIFFVTIIFALRKFFHDLNGQADCIKN